MLHSEPTPEHRSGQVKIISVERSAKILAHDGRSLVTDVSFNPFRPPITDRSSGSKSDIWSFGCVVIQMIDGKLTMDDSDRLAWSRADGLKGSSPRIPQGLPDKSQLKDIIQRCLEPKYEDRPEAATILGRRTLEREDLKNLDWACPSRNNF